MTSDESARLAALQERLVSRPDVLAAFITPVFELTITRRNGAQRSIIGSVPELERFIDSTLGSP